MKTMMKQEKRTAIPTPRRGLRWTVAAVVVAAGGALGAGAFAQPADPGAGRPPEMHRHGGPGMGGAGMMGPGLFMGRPEHMNRMLDRWLDGLNATEVQRTQIKQIALAAATDLRAQHEAARGLREQGLQLFAAPTATVDAAAVESLRQRMLAQHDQASQRVTQALIETANLLTPEQRARMVERMQQRGEHMRGRDAAPRTPPGNS